MTRRKKVTKPQDLFYERVREILESARSGIARSVNTTHVVANWLIGREIVEEEQNGRDRADYGKRIVETLSRRITLDFGAGYSSQSLFYMKQFYQTFPAPASSEANSPRTAWRIEGR
jgi:hypothetical protein